MCIVRRKLQHGTFEPDGSLAANCNSLRCNIIDQGYEFDMFVVFRVCVCVHACALRASRKQSGRRLSCSLMTSASVTSARPPASCQPWPAPTARSAQSVSTTQRTCARAPPTNSTSGNAFDDVFSPFSTEGYQLNLPPLDYLVLVMDVFRFPLHLFNVTGCYSDAEGSYFVVINVAKATTILTTMSAIKRLLFIFAKWLFA